MSPVNIMSTKFTKLHGVSHYRKRCITVFFFVIPEKNRLLTLKSHAKVKKYFVSHEWFYDFPRLLMAFMSIKKFSQGHEKRD